MKLQSMTLESVLQSIFSTHQIKIKQNIAYGTAVIEKQPFYIVGTVENTFLGVDEAIVIADCLLDVLDKNDDIPVLLFVDVIGQKLQMRDESLGMFSYFSHILECIYLLRHAQHRVLSLIYNQAIGGSFIAFGASAERVFALSHATVAVMWLDAMSKITKIDESILTQISKTSPVFAPGVLNFKKLGGIHEVVTLPQARKQFLAFLRTAPNPVDERARLGYELGGRQKAYPIIEKIKSL